MKIFRLLPTVKWVARNGCASAGMDVLSIFVREDFVVVLSGLPERYVFYPYTSRSCFMVSHGRNSGRENSSVVR